MAKFIILLTGEGGFDKLSPAEMQAAIGKYVAFAARLRAENRLVDADGLDMTARVLKSTPTGVVVSDGPFPETKEMVGGYYAFTAADYDEAEEIARSCPTLEFGGKVEIRRVMDHS